jgi:hypothetical protein
MSARLGAPVRARIVTTAVVLGVTLLVAAPAVPAGAGTPAAPRPRPGLCARVQTQWGRLVLANQRAKLAFQKASALRARLVRAGRSRLGHRLDRRLEYLRQRHLTLVARVDAIAARANGICPDRPPVLEGF